jgi:hypothetical protein
VVAPGAWAGIRVVGGVGIWRCRCVRWPGITVKWHVVARGAWAGCRVVGGHMEVQVRLTAGHGGDLGYSDTWSGFATLGDQPSLGLGWIQGFV